jgi:DNA-3-methyladenine glycosylase I
MSYPTPALGGHSKTLFLLLLAAFTSQARTINITTNDSYAKIEAAVNNAKRLMEVRDEFGTFARYMWSWVDHKPIDNRLRSIKDCKPFTDEALRWSKDLKKRGFQFLGPTVVYAHMQAVGMVNDHIVTCFRYREVQRSSKK